MDNILELIEESNNMLIEEYDNIRIYDSSNRSY